MCTPLNKEQASTLLIPHYPLPPLSEGRNHSLPHRGHFCPFSAKLSKKTRARPIVSALLDKGAKTHSFSSKPITRFTSARERFLHHRGITFRIGTHQRSIGSLAFLRAGRTPLRIFSLFFPNWISSFVLGLFFFVARPLFACVFAHWFTLLRERSDQSGFRR